MNLAELARRATEAYPGTMTLAITGPWPKGFPHGELLSCVGDRRLYQFKADAILRFCKRCSIEEEQI